MRTKLFELLKFESLKNENVEKLQFENKHQTLKIVNLKLEQVNMTMCKLNDLFFKFQKLKIEI